MAKTEEVLPEGLLDLSFSFYFLIARYGHTEGLPEGLLNALLPGPVTVLLRRRASAPVCQEAVATRDTLALRVPGMRTYAVWVFSAGLFLASCIDSRTLLT